MAQQFPEIPHPDIDPIAFPPPVEVERAEPEQPFVAETTVAKDASEEGGGVGPLVGAGDSGSSQASTIGGLEVALLALATSAVGVVLWLNRKRLVR
ncbi:MAG TPA: hypothetical protein VFO84_03720 [Dehalococcoidia bacterium]|nr:hypothetical protein [Dehalococcoidia bacterium]